jgi:hypothetical protein
MNQAEGAIDAARAARADRYAAAEYEAAVTALKQAQEAVAQRDYRLALNYALDSRQRAQNAAKEAADQQVLLRSRTERQLGDVTAMLDRASRRLAAAESTRLPRRAMEQPRATIAEVQTSLQKAGTEIQEGEYLASQKRMDEAARQLQSAIAALDAAARGRAGRQKR